MRGFYFLDTMVLPHFNAGATSGRCWRDTQHAVGAKSNVCTHFEARRGHPILADEVHQEHVVAQHAWPRATDGVVVLQEQPAQHTRRLVAPRCTSPSWPEAAQTKEEGAQAGSGCGIPSQPTP